eukprot:scaffold53384_cov34-Tisochrysis_lutea.AAC.4
MTDSSLREEGPEAESGMGREEEKICHTPREEKRKYRGGKARRERQGERGRYFKRGQILLTPPREGQRRIWAEREGKTGGA